MSDVIAITTSVSAQALEHILGTGDLSKLTVQQRVEFYAKTCQSLGLNPLTRPFRFLSFQGQTVMYATRDATDQLRALRKISIRITDQRLDGDLFIVTAQASTPDGRHDEDIGAVTIGKLMGDSRANATMRAMTKAKRRVTLSIVGLGMLSEDELDTMPGATTFDAEAEPEPPPPQRVAAAATSRAPRVAERAPTGNGNGNPATRTKEQWDTFLEKLRAALGVVRTRAEVVEIGGKQTVGDAIAHGPDWAQREISAALADAYGRFPDEPENAATDPGDHPDGGPRIGGEAFAGA